MSLNRNEWKDITSYSRSDAERVPRSFEIFLGPVRLVVTRKMHMDGWYADAQPFLVARPLPSADVETSKKDAMSMLIVLLDQARTAAGAVFERA